MAIFCSSAVPPSCFAGLFVQHSLSRYAWWGGLRSPRAPTSAPAAANGLGGWLNLTPGRLTAPRGATSSFRAGPRRRWERRAARGQACQRIAASRYACWISEKRQGQWQKHSSPLARKTRIVGRWPGAGGPAWACKGTASSLSPVSKYGGARCVRPRLPAALPAWHFALRLRLAEPLRLSFALLSLRRRRRREVCWAALGPAGLGSAPGAAVLYGGQIGGGRVERELERRACHHPASSIPSGS
jgi:hypothetical protein